MGMSKAKAQSLIGEKYETINEQDVNAMESITGLDIDGDGDVGEMGHKNSPDFVEVFRRSLVEEQKTGSSFHRDDASTRSSGSAKAKPAKKRNVLDGAEIDSELAALVMREYLLPLFEGGAAAQGPADENSPSSGVYAEMKLSNRLHRCL